MRAVSTIILAISLLPSLAQMGIQPLGILCEGDSSVQLIAAPTGGIWGGDADTSGVVNTTAGISGNPYSATYTYIDSVGATIVDSVGFVVNPLPVVSIIPAGPFCETAGLQQLEASLNGGVWGSTDGSTDQDGVFNPFYGMINSPYTAWYSFTDSVGCSSTDTTTIEVLSAPVVTLFAPGNACPDDSAFYVTASPDSGIWLAGVDSVGLFDPANSVPGTYQVVYSFTDSVGCTNVASITIELLGFAIPSGFSFTSICSNSGPDTLEATGLVGGILFSGAAEPNGVVYPDSLSIGMHTVNYMTGCLNCCPYQGSFPLSVIEPTSIELVDSVICADLDSVIMTGIGDVMSWGGVADSNGYIFPNFLSPGLHPVITNGNDILGCQVTDTSYVNLQPRPNVTLTSNSPYCSGSLPDTLIVNPTGGSWIGAIDSGGVFTRLDTAGVYPIIYIYSDSGFCTNFLYDTLIVASSPLVSIDPVPGFCNTDAPYLMSATPTGGSWSGGSTSSGIFDPGQALISGTIPVYYSVVDTAGCTGIDSTTVVVLLEPEIVFGANGPYCQGVGLQTLVATPGLGIWGGAAFPDGTFDGNNEPDTYIIEYTVSNGLCTVTAFDTVIVDDCTYIEEYNTDNWKLYPDPADDQFVIETDKTVDCERLEILDSQGRIVYLATNEIFARRSIRTESWDPGHYYLLLNGIPIKKFTVLH